MNRFSRRAFAFGSLAAGAVARRLPAGAQSLPTVRTSAVPIDLSGAAYYAQAQGMFAKHGISVEITTMTNGSQAAAAVVGGSLDFCSANITTMSSAHQSGLPFVIVAPSAAYSSKAPTGALVALQSSPLHAAKDVAGKTIGLSSVRGVSYVSMRAWLDQNGVSADAVKFLEVPFSDMGPALAAGRVDAVMSEEPAQSHILANGGRIVALVNDAIAPTWLEGGYFCTLDFATKNADLAHRFADALAEANVWANKNHDATAKILESITKAPFNPAQQRAYYPERVDPAQLQPVIDASAKYGLLKASFPAKDLIAPGF